MANIAPTKNKDGQSNTMTDRQNSLNRTKINGFPDYLPFFSEHFPPVTFVSSWKRALTLHVPASAFLHLVTRASSSIHPALSHWWTEVKIRFPNYSNGPLFLSFSVLYPEKLKLQAASSSKRSLKKPVYGKNMLNLKENEILPSLVVI